MTGGDDDFDPVSLGTDDPGEDLAVLRGPDGRALIVPRSLRRLEGEQLEVVSDLQRAAQLVHEWQRKVDELVQEAREYDVSWNAIGWSVGTSGEAARQRWGIPRE